MAVPPPYVILPLSPQHDRQAFTSAEPSLDAYLQRQAGQDVKRGLAACYVLTERGDTDIQGYYTLSASSVELRTLPPDLAKTAGRYPLIPAILLGRLAVDQRARGRGFGAVLLADALRRALRTGVGVKLVVVDALHEAAAAFYQHFGFRPFAETPMRLYMAVDTIRGLYPDLPVPEAGGSATPGGDAPTEGP
ncbi:MAG TPA: GNAT family N-acetyltransferase [Ktedonobacterales bacterium]|nr:GNAT family N-acetyltransferase [Ktedonobacterales bacterium]